MEMLLKMKLGLFADSAALFSRFCYGLLDAAEHSTGEILPINLPLRYRHLAFVGLAPPSASTVTSSTCYTTRSAIAMPCL